MDSCDSGAGGKPKTGPTLGPEVQRCTRRPLLKARLFWVFDRHELLQVQNMSKNLENKLRRYPQQLESSSVSFHFFMYGRENFVKKIPQYLHRNLSEPDLNICTGTFCANTFCTGTFRNLTSISAPEPPGT